MQTKDSEVSKKTPEKRSTSSRRSRRRLWFGLVVLVLLIGAGVYYFVIRKQNGAAAASQTPALQTATARTGNIILRASGTGTLIAAQESNVGFKTSGTLTTLNVKVGDQVKKGDLIATLDNSSQTLALQQAQEALNELTSPSAIATAELAVTTAQANVINAQEALNNLKYWQNQPLTQDQTAALVIAKANYDKAQAAYDKLNTGGYITNSNQAAAYESMYNAQKAYDTAQFNLSMYSQAPTARAYNAAQATLDLANATVVEDQNLVTALTGGSVPSDATGSGLSQLNQAKLAVQTAQDNLANTKLYAPISGTVMSISNVVGDTISSGGTFITIDDLSQAELQIYMDSLDYSNIKVGYTTNVVFDALPNQTFTGKVTLIDPQLVTIQGNSVVEGNVLLDQNQASGDTVSLPLGVTASVDIIAAQANNVVLVPVQALHELSPNNYAVFVMTNGTPKLTMVTVGLQDGTFAEIKSGLKAGDVVTTGIQATSSGNQAGPTP